VTARTVRRIGRGSSTAIRRTPGGIVPTIRLGTVATPGRAATRPSREGQSSFALRARAACASDSGAAMPSGSLPRRPVGRFSSSGQVPCSHEGRDVLGGGLGMLMLRSVAGPREGQQLESRQG
jgi:hypothetical protein